MAEIEEEMEDLTRNSKLVLDIEEMLNHDG